MLIDITERCNGDCIHCLNSATSEGSDMTMDTFKAALDFAGNFDLPAVSLAGGEPTLHPLILEFVNLAKTSGFHISVLSNGSFAHNREMTRALKESGATIQVTYDSRYYPHKVPLERLQHKNICIETHVQNIYPIGRAVLNRIPDNSKAPKCFNLRSFARSTSDLRSAIAGLRAFQKFCTPTIHYDGSLGAGESRFCHRFGAIWDDPKDLVKNLCDMRCNHCGMEDRLEGPYRTAIGLEGKA